jgi:hypothetical protein
MGMYSKTYYLRIWTKKVKSSQKGRIDGLPSHQVIGLLSSVLVVPLGPASYQSHDLLLSFSP